MNSLGQPTFSFDKSIHEYDVSVGRLQPQKIPDNVYRRLNIDRTPRVPLPTLDLGTLDRRIKFNIEKDKLNRYYTKQPQLIKEPKDTRISLEELAKKGKTLYDIYNKTQKAKPEAEPEPEPELEEEQFEIDDDDFPEGKHDETKPEAPTRRAPTRPERLDPTLREIEQPSISVIQEEVKIPSGETVRRLPEQKFPEAPTRRAPTRPERLDPRLIGEKPSVANIYFEEERPHISLPTWRPIQAIETKTDIPFFIPSVVGEDPLQPSLVAPEREVMVDEPVNIHIDDEPVMIHY